MPPLRWVPASGSGYRASVNSSLPGGPFPEKPQAKASDWYSTQLCSYPNWRPSSAQPCQRMARVSLDFCLTFLPGCSDVPAADAVMLFVCKCPSSTITAWFLTYPLVRCRWQLARRRGTISVAKGVNFRDHATDRLKHRACGGPAFRTAGQSSCLFSALRDSHFRFRTEGVRGEEALYR